MSSVTTKFKDTAIKKRPRHAESPLSHPADVTQYRDGEFKKIPIELVNPDPNQPRQYFDETALKELSDSIKQKGVLQPVIVRIDENSKIWLVAGERRYRAAKMAGINAIPAMITTGNPAEIALIENLQRENLKPIEEAEALGRMVRDYNYTQEQLAQVIGKAQSTISETLSLNKLPDEIKEEYRRADIPRRLLVEVCKQKTPEAMIALLNQIKEGQLRSDDVRKITRKKGTKRTLRTPAAIALDRTAQLANYLPKVDLNNIQENEKIQLLTELQSLNNLINKLIR